MTVLVHNRRTTPGGVVVDLEVDHLLVQGVRVVEVRGKRHLRFPGPVQVLEHATYRDLRAATLSQLGLGS